MRPALIALLLLLALAGSSARTLAQESTPSQRASRIHSEIRDILSRPEYAVQPPGESALDKVGRWLREKWNAFSEWWNRLFSFGGRTSAGTAQFFMWVVLALLIVGIAYVLAYAFRKLGWRIGARGRRDPTVSVTEEAIEEQIDDPEGLLAAARELAAAGHYRRAYRAIFLAILLRLDRTGLIRFERCRTNGEYLRALRSRPEVLTWMRPLTNDFDLRWYGGHPVEETDYRRITRDYERLAEQPPAS